MKYLNNKLLLEYQDRFLESGDLNAWSLLWQLSLEICTNMIYGEMKRKGFRLAKDEIKDKAMESVIYVLRRYRTRKGYKIHKSFLNALKFSITHALYYQTKEQRVYNAAISLDSPKMINISSDKVLNYIPRFEDTVHR